MKRSKHRKRERRNMLRAFNSMKIDMYNSIALTGYYCEIATIVTGTKYTALRLLGAMKFKGLVTDARLIKHDYQSDNRYSVIIRVDYGGK